MKVSKAQIQGRHQAISAIKFEDQQLTSYAGAVLLQPLFERLFLTNRLEAALATIESRGAYGLGTVFLQLVLQLMLGFHCYRDRDAYQGDPLLANILRLKQFPDVATLSRVLSGAGPACVDAIRGLIRRLVLERLENSVLRRITLDFDGSVLSTRRHAEGTAVGFNRHRKGERSYYPLFCTISQLGMLFDFHHRPGNVHDSNGASAFVTHCIDKVRQFLPTRVLEVRMDSAFFQETLLQTLHTMSVGFSASVPFDRFPVLKKEVEGSVDWKRINANWDYCEVDWKPKCWTSSSNFRTVLFRQRSLQQRKGPLQLDLFIPRDTEFEFKAIVTNMKLGAAALLAFHNGRGVQEGIFGDAKIGAGLGYIPSQTLVANQLFLAAAMLAHNLGREFGWRVAGQSPRTTANRAPSVVLPQLETLQKYYFHRAGRFTRPQGRLVLTISANKVIQKQMLHHMQILGLAA